MNKWNELTDEEQKEIFIQTSIKKGLPAAAIEKDWWVMIALRALFNSSINEHLLFKGGTSLSKSWGLIDRFSEDIDLAMDRSYFGLQGKLSKTKVKTLRKTSCAFVANELPTILAAELNKIGITEFDTKIIPFEDSDTDPVAIELRYPALTETEQYIIPRVLIEVSSRSLTDPYEIRKLQSFVAESYPDKEFIDSGIEIPSVHPKRTFLEKIFLLHEEFQKPADRKIISERKSRHLYDIVRIMDTEHCEKALNDTELYQTIIDHRKRYTPISWVDYSTHLPQTLNFIPPELELINWKKDYESMSESMFYGEVLSFEKLLEKMNSLQERIRNIKL